MILAMTPNLAWDVTYEVERLTPGTSHRVRHVHGQAGGKGVNVARVAHALAHPVHVLSLTGGPSGGSAAADIDAAGLPATLLPIRGTTRQSITVVPEQPGSDGGEPSVFNEPGPTVTRAEWTNLLDSAAAHVRGTDTGALTVSGSLPGGVGREQVAALLTATDVPCYVDTSGPALRWAATDGAALVKANRSELLEATGANDIESGVRVLHELGAAQVVVTDGAAVMYAFDAGPDAATPRTWRARVPHHVPGNPTGAGDAALAALAIQRDGPWEHRLRYAVAVSAAAVAEPVAGKVTPERVRSMHEQVLVEPVETS